MAASYQARGASRERRVPRGGRDGPFVRGGPGGDDRPVARCDADPDACSAEAEAQPVPPADAPVAAVVFDLFDTLIDLDFSHLPVVDVGGRSAHSTYPLIHEALKRHAAVHFDRFAEVLLEVDGEIARGPHARCEEVSTRSRFALLAQRLGLDPDEVAPVLSRVHMAALRSGARWHPESVDVLRRVRETRPVGICSNFTDAATACALLDAAGLSPHVDAVAISEAVGVRKPRPEPFRAVLAELGVSAGAAVHVGDQLRDDVLGAAGVGMRSAWAARRVRDPDQRRAACPEARPTWVVRALAELLDVLPAASTR
jgi:putative hydrolase of the HAD superfamily